MKSASRGAATSQVEVSGISALGVWLFLGDRELFLPFEDFQWFREAPVAGVLHVERPQPHHLYWPDLDIDLDLASLEHPEAFPLISRERPDPRSLRAAKTKRSPRTKRAARSRRG